MGKAVNGDAVVDDIIPHFPAKTGIFGNQLLDVLEALRVFGVPLDRTDAVSFVIIGYFIIFGGIFYENWWSTNLRKNNFFVFGNLNDHALIQAVVDR